MHPLCYQLDASMHMQLAVVFSLLLLTSCLMRIQNSQEFQAFWADSMLQLAAICGDKPLTAAATQHLALGNRQPIKMTTEDA